MLRNLLCAAALAALSVTAASAQHAPDHRAKVTLVYDQPLPNVPGKSIRGVLVEYEPGGSSPAHTHPNFGIHLRNGPSRARSEARSTTDR